MIDRLYYAPENLFRRAVAEQSSDAARLHDVRRRLAPCTQEKQIAERQHRPERGLLDTASTVSAQ